MISNLVYYLLALFLVARTVTFYLTLPQTAPLPAGKAVLAGRLQDEPRTTAQAQFFSLAGVEVVKTRFPEVSYGDKITLEGEIKYFEGRPKMLFPQVKLIENPKDLDWRKPLFEFKKKIISRIQSLFPEPEAGLLSGILLGDKASLDPAFKRAIQNTGLTHVVVASGANLTFVSGLVFGLALILVGRRWAGLLALPVIWLYAVMTGFEAAVVRAALMVSFSYLARFWGRDEGTWRGLGAAVYIMILFDPQIITDLGFQLSVAAMAGVIVSGGGVLKQTLGAQIATLPLILGTFARYGLLSFVSNLLVLWTVPWIMVLGLVSLTGFSFPAQIFLRYFVLVAEFFGRFDNLVLALPRLDMTAIVGIYFIMAAIYVHRRTASSVERV